jgi:hypothetical protein
VSRSSFSQSIPFCNVQEVFEACRPDFITRSRERQKLIALKAEERSLQAMLDEERRKLFQINRKKETDPVSHPYSGTLTEILLFIPTTFG